MMLAGGAVLLFTNYAMSAGAGHGPSSQPLPYRALEFLVSVPIPLERFASGQSVTALVIVGISNVGIWSLICGCCWAALYTAFTGLRNDRMAATGPPAPSSRWRLSRRAWLLVAGFCALMVWWGANRRIGGWGDFAFIVVLAAIGLISLINGIRPVRQAE
jgi:hypothetical protein